MLWAGLALPWAADAHADERPYVETLQLRSRRLGVAESREWEVLLHYRHRPGGRIESEIDGAGFFVDVRGKSDPQRELDATIASFFEDPARVGVDEQHPQCRFPARYALLSGRLSFDPGRLPPIRCERFERWRSTLGAQGATLIFSAAYLNNPASLFGHTFLRLDRRRRTRGSDLLAYSVNFSATPTTSNALLYAFLGLTGGFEGNFSTLPYYLKVREYNDGESRDMWEYELSLTPEEVDRLARHLWDIGLSVADYFYMDENCSYQILTLLEVARPSLHLVDRFEVTVHPADTVRAVLAMPGLVRSKRFRPSNRTRMLARRAQLRGDEVDLAARAGAVGERSAIREAARREPPRAALILDTAYELFRFEAGQEDYEPPEQAHEDALLEARAGIAVTTDAPPVHPPAPLEAGHASSVTGLGGGASETGPFVQFTLRPALHDLLGAQRGYAPNTEIGFFRLDLRQPADVGLPVLERFDILRIVSLVPLDPWVRKPSWRLATGVERVREDGCERSRCAFYHFTVGPGVAVGGPLLTAYAFLDVELGAGGVFRDDYRIQGGASVGGLAQPLSFFRLLVEASYLYPLLGVDRPAPVPGPADGAPFRLQAAASFRLSRNVELRAPAVLGRGYREAGGALFVYF